ncbi:MAG TPA: hypothetical protein VGQ12_13545 [Candidatus Angelobacter sp.]|nr:hypothetical protein [Candidatus Angelobacter sp.]
MRCFKPVMLLLTSAAAAALLLFSGCDSRAKIEARMEKPVPANAQPTPQSAPTPMPKLPPPTAAEVEAAFHRVFGDTLVAERGTAQFFIVGDFNGDASEDLAVLARPAPGKLNDVNSELSNWIIQDADKAFIPNTSKAVVKPPKPETLTIANGEEILAIIHGFGPKGWRNPDARQAYLLKHAAATFQGIAPSISQKAIRAMKLPFATDIIKEVRNNKRGFLFWTGSMYAWHPSEG